MKILVTGGAGFIGSAVIRHIISQQKDTIINLDKLTYAGNLNSLSAVCDNPRYHFIQADICDRNTLDQLLAKHLPDAIIHLAAESHVDRAIDAPAAFMQTNLIGTYTLLEATRHYLSQQPSSCQREFRFLHVSTDEVYGDLPYPKNSADAINQRFTEAHPYRPNNPYSASKAGADHLVRAWHHTYGLPVIVTNSSNNYGPYQFPEKLIPLITRRALAANPLPVYGDGHQIRDWLHVNDHARALYRVITQGRVGDTYNIGAHNEKTNKEVVLAICRQLDELASQGLIPQPQQHHADLITHVADRPGHDKRYALDARKITQQLGWQPQMSFADGLHQTIRWYIDHPHWGPHSSHSPEQRLGLGNSEA